MISSPVSSSSCTFVAAGSGAVRLFALSGHLSPAVSSMAASLGTGSTATIVREGWLQKRGEATQ